MFFFLFTLLAFFGFLNSNKQFYQWNVLSYTHKHMHNNLGAISHQNTVNEYQFLSAPQLNSAISLNFPAFSVAKFFWLMLVVAFVSKLIVFVINKQMSCWCNTNKSL